jgi:hypothetical protein
VSPSLGGALGPAETYAWTGNHSHTGTVTESGASRLYGATAPLSGPGGTGYLVAANGSTYLNTQTKVLYVNEAGVASPYWTPLGIDSHPNMLSWSCDFKDFLGKAHANTDAVAILAGSGLRIHGQGIAETDSGVVVTAAEGGPAARLTTTDEDAHLVALSFGTTDSGAGPLQPDTHGPLVVEATLTQVTALTLRRVFLGFLGTWADALDPPATGLTTTITLVQDDLGGLFMDAGLTAATAFFAISNNNDAAASQTTASAAVSPATVMPAAATHVRLRVEVTAAGTMYCFADRVLIATIQSAVDITEEFAPVLLIGSTSAAIKAMDVRRIAAWGTRA